MKTVLETAPTAYPVSLADAKDNALIFHSGQDAELQGMLFAATDEVEKLTCRKLLTQTWKYYLDCFPGHDFIRIPYGRLQSVSSIVYTDSDGTANTWDSSEYIVDTLSEPGRVVLGYGESFPSFTEYPSNPICITFVCGWTSPASIPQKIKMAIKLLFQDLYEGHSENKQTVLSLLSDQTVYGVYP